jgi:hypothetical protein
MKITDVLISAIVKKGILYEARNCNMDFEVPISQESPNGGAKDNKIHIQFKAEHMTLRIEKDKTES